MIRLLKLSETQDDLLGSEEILSIHLGHYWAHGKVTYCTNVAVAEKPKYVLLVLGNVTDICYLCRVNDYIYNSEPLYVEQLNTKNEDFINYSPNRYKGDQCKTWFVFDLIQKIPIDFLDQLLLDRSDKSVYEFIKERANNKKI